MRANTHHRRIELAAHSRGRRGFGHLPEGGHYLLKILFSYSGFQCKNSTHRCVRAPRSVLRCVRHTSRAFFYCQIPFTLLGEQKQHRVHTVSKRVAGCGVLTRMCAHPKKKWPEMIFDAWPCPGLCAYLCCKPCHDRPLPRAHPVLVVSVLPPCSTPLCVLNKHMSLNNLFLSFLV